MILATKLDDMQARFRAVAKALEQPPPLPIPQVVLVPAKPHSWLFTVARDDEGRIASMLAEPVE